MTDRVTGIVTACDRGALVYSPAKKRAGPMARVRGLYPDAARGPTDSLTPRLGVPSPFEMPVSACQRATVARWRRFKSAH